MSSNTVSLVNGFALLGLLVLISFAWPHPWAKDVVLCVIFALGFGWCGALAESVAPTYGTIPYLMVFWCAVAATGLAIILTILGVFF